VTLNQYSGQHGVGLAWPGGPVNVAGKTGRDCLLSLACWCIIG